MTAPTSGLGGRLRELSEWLTDNNIDMRMPVGMVDPKRAAALADRAGDVEGLARVLRRFEWLPEGAGHQSDRDLFWLGLAEAISNHLLGSASNAPPEPPANT